jgi:hypothetical protein
LAQNVGNRVAGKIPRQHATGGSTDEIIRCVNAIDRVICRLIRKTYAIEDLKIDIDDLEGLPPIAVAGNQIACLRRV